MTWRALPRPGQLAKAGMNDLQTIEGVGPNIAEAIVDWFVRLPNRTVWKAARSGSVADGSCQPRMPQKYRTTQRDDLCHYRHTAQLWSREDDKKYIQVHGGKVTDAVSKKTSYLVVGETPGFEAWIRNANWVCRFWMKTLL